MGTVSAACLSADGHQVVGVDTSITKVELINAGAAPIVEKDVAPLLTSALAAGSLRATSDVREAVADSELSLICVGTPSLRNGSLDLGHVQRVCEQIGECLADLQRFHVVAIRSTMLPGSIRSVVIPALERSSGSPRRTSTSASAYNPEFLREGLCGVGLPQSAEDGDRCDRRILGADLVERLYAKLAGAIC